MNSKCDDCGETMAESTAIEQASLIDNRIAARLALARRQSGMSLSDAGQAAGVSYQQIQKYENGSNRITGGVLALLAGLYERPISWFFHAEGAADTLDASAAPDRIDMAVNELLAAVRQARLEKPQSAS